jgi:hypothetical protein
VSTVAFPSSCSTSISCPLACECAVEPLCAGSSSFPHEWHQTAPPLSKPRTASTPCHGAGHHRVCAVVLCSSLVKPTDTPRRAVVPCAECRAMPRDSVDRPSCRGDHVQGTRVRGLWPCTPQRQGQAHASNPPLTLVGGFHLCCHAALACEPAFAPSLSFSSM